MFVDIRDRCLREQHYFVIRHTIDRVARDADQTSVDKFEREFEGDEKSTLHFAKLSRSRSRHRSPKLLQAFAERKFKPRLRRNKLAVIISHFRRKFFLWSSHVTRRPLGNPAHRILVG